MIAVIVIALIALLVAGPTLWVRTVMRRHGGDRPEFPGTGGEFARHLLDEHGLQEVDVEITTAGDHYDGEAKKVRLSRSNYEGRSVTAVAVAAHEVGHALQDRDGYRPLAWRKHVVRLAGITDKVGSIALVGLSVVSGAIVSPRMILVGLAAVVLMGLIRVAAHAVTLPVELDASFRRALPIILQGRYLHEDDEPAARSVLKAAAYTYVAASLIGLIDLMRILRALRQPNTNSANRTWSSSPYRDNLVLPLHRSHAVFNMTHPVFPGTCRRLILLATIMVLAVSGAHAQESLVYDGPVPVRIDGRSVDIPVRISGEATGDGREITLHALVGADDLQPALLALAKDLAGKASKRCELRFSVSDAGMKVDAGQIILSVKARTEVWVCSSFLKTRLGRERAVVQASVIPTVADGRLQLEPTGITISGVSDLLREVGGEAVMEYLFSQIVDRFNDDPRMNTLPQSLAEAGYAYSGVQAGGAFGDNVLRVSITGPNDLLGLWKRTLGAR